MAVLYSSSRIFVIPVYIFNGRKQTLVDTIGILSALHMCGLHDKRHLLAKLRIAGSENWIFHIFNFFLFFRNWWPTDNLTFLFAHLTRWRLVLTIFGWGLWHMCVIANSNRLQGVNRRTGPRCIKLFARLFFCHKKTLANLYANCNGNIFFAGVSWFLP